LNLAAYIPPNNPPSNISPNPDFFASCSFSGGELDNSEDCTNAALEATNYARSQEDVGAMILPTNYANLTAAQQLFIVANLERVGRGLPPMLGLVASYNSDAQTGANDDTDPIGPGSNADLWGSNWAGGYPSVLGSNYGWMYTDGPGGDNIDCTKSNTAGCWGHRDNILGNYSKYGGTPLMGAACSLTTSASPSMTQLFVEYSSTTPPPMVYTWQEALETIPPSPSTSSSSGSGSKTTVALAATFTVLAVVGIGAVIVFILYRRRKANSIPMLDSMKEFFGKFSRNGSSSTSTSSTVSQIPETLKPQKTLPPTPAKAKLPPPPAPPSSSSSSFKNVSNNSLSSSINKPLASSAVPPPPPSGSSPIGKQTSPSPSPRPPIPYRRQ